MKKANAAIIIIGNEILSGRTQDVNVVSISNWLNELGVKLEELLISQPDTGEQGLEIADSLIKSGGIDVLVIDSVAALVPRAELEGDMGD